MDDFVWVVFSKIEKGLEVNLFSQTFSVFTPVTCDRGVRDQWATRKNTTMVSLTVASVSSVRDSKICNDP